MSSTKAAKSCSPKVRLLPLVPASFFGSSAEAAKSCSLRRDCCLWSRRVSSGLRQRQQNPASVARLLPLVPASFFGSSAEATKSCSQGAIAAFGPGEFHRVSGRGSKILLLRRDCCLWSWRVSPGLRQRQQNPAPKARLLPLVTASFIGSPAEAAKSCS